MLESTTIILQGDIFYISIFSRDVKMSFNPWAYLTHHVFEPGWVEKNSIFSKVDWTQSNSLNSRVKRVRAKLNVGWHT